MSSTQKGEQVQYPEPPPKERPPDPTVVDNPAGGQGTKENRGHLPSLLDFLPDNDRNSTGTANPPSQAKKGHGLKLPPFLEPGMEKTSTSNSPPSPTTPAPPPLGPINPPFGPPPPADTDHPSKPEATLVPLPPAALAKPDDNAPPPAQTTTTTSDGGAATVSPTVTSSTSIIEHGASFPTGEVYSSVLPATSSSQTTNTKTIKGAFVYVTTAVDSTSYTK